MAILVASSMLIWAQISAPPHLKPLTNQLFSYPGQPEPALILQQGTFRSTLTPLSAPLLPAVKTTYDKIKALLPQQLLVAKVTEDSGGGSRPKVIKPTTTVKDKGEKDNPPPKTIPKTNPAPTPKATPKPKAEQTIDDERQNAYTNTYGDESGRYNYNYETGKAATTSEWNDPKANIAGTYVAPNGKRYSVNVASTKKAEGDFVNAVGSSITTLSDKEILDLAAAKNPSSKCPPGDKACEKALIASTLTQITKDSFAGNVSQDTITAITDGQRKNTEFQNKLQAFMDPSKSLSDLTGCQASSNGECYGLTYEIYLTTLGIAKDQIPSLIAERETNVESLKNARIVQKAQTDIVNKFLNYSEEKLKQEFCPPNVSADLCQKMLSGGILRSAGIAEEDIQKLVKQKEALTVITEYQTSTLITPITPAAGARGPATQAIATQTAKKEREEIIATCFELGGINCDNKTTALSSLTYIAGTPELTAALIESNKVTFAQENKAYAAVSKTLMNLGSYDSALTEVKEGRTTWSEIQKTLDNQTGINAFVTDWNDFTGGRFKRGNDQLLASVNPENNYYKGLASITLSVAINPVTSYFGDQKKLVTADQIGSALFGLEGHIDEAGAIKGSLIQGGDAAAVITAAAAIPLAPLAGVGTAGFFTTGLGVVGTTQMVGQATDTCELVNQGLRTQSECNTSVAMATISVLGTGLGVLNQAGQAVRTGAAVSNLTRNVGTVAAGSTKALKVVEAGTDVLSLGTFSVMAHDTCEATGLASLDCASTIAMAVASGGKLVGNAGLLRATGQAGQTALTNTHTASAGLFAVSACSKLGEDQSLDTLSMCAFGVSGLGQDLVARNNTPIADKPITTAEKNERIATPEELARLPVSDITAPKPETVVTPVKKPNIVTTITERLFGASKPAVTTVDRTIKLNPEYEGLVKKLGALQETRQESALAGKDPVFVAETKMLPDGKSVTEFKFNETVTERAGMTEVELTKLNQVFTEYQIFSEKQIGFDAALGLRGQQASYLVSGLEAFAANHTTGSLFGALPGLGKTEVVLPMLTYLHASMTNDPQFVLFPEAKLMRPWVNVDAKGVIKPNAEIINFFEAKFGKDSVLILETGKTPSSTQVKDAKIIISTRDAAFELQKTNEPLREKWKEAYKFVDESHWTTNLFENFRSSDAVEKIGNIPEATAFKDAIEAVRKLPGVAELIEARKTGALTEVKLTGDGKTGEYSVEREVKILNEILEAHKSLLREDLQNLKIDAANLKEIKTALDQFIDQNYSSSAEVKQLARELTAINKLADLLAAVPGTHYGLAKSNGELSIAPREQSRETGRTYSNLAEQILYNTVGVEVLKGVGEMTPATNINVDNLTVSRGGSETTYARLMLEGKGFAMFTGTPELMAKLYKIAYGIDLKVFSKSAFETVTERFVASDNNGIFTSIADQIAARQSEGRNQVYTNMDATTNNAATRDYLASQHGEGKAMFIETAAGEHLQGVIEAGKFRETTKLESSEAMGRAQDAAREFVKLYEYGAHTGVDSPNNIATSRAIGICNGCDQTTFSQGINRVRLDANGNAAPMDIIYLDAPVKTTDKVNLFSEFTKSTQTNEVKNMTIAEVNFKEILLKTAVDITFERLLAQTDSGLLARFTDGNMKIKIEAIQKSWKEVSEQSYRLDNSDFTPEQKLNKTLDQVKGVMTSLDKVVGNNQKLRAEFDAAAGGYKTLEITFSDVQTIKTLSEKPSLSDVVELINNTSAELKNSAVTFREKGATSETIAVAGQEAVSRTTTPTQQATTPSLFTRVTDTVKTWFSRETSTTTNSSALEQLTNLPLLKYLNFTPNLTTTPTTLSPQEKSNVSNVEIDNSLSILTTPTLDDLPIENFMEDESLDLTLTAEDGETLHFMTQNDTLTLEHNGESAVPITLEGALDILPDPAETNTIVLNGTPLDPAVYELPVQDTVTTKLSLSEQLAESIFDLITNAGTIPFIDISQTQPLHVRERSHHVPFPSLNSVAQAKITQSEYTTKKGDLNEAFFEVYINPNDPSSLLLQPTRSLPLQTIISVTRKGKESETKSLSEFLTPAGDLILSVRDQIIFGGLKLWIYDHAGFNENEIRWDNDVTHPNDLQVQSTNLEKMHTWATSTDPKIGSANSFVRTLRLNKYRTALTEFDTDVQQRLTTIADLSSVLESYLTTNPSRADMLNYTYAEATKPEYSLTTTEINNLLFSINSLMTQHERVEALRAEYGESEDDANRMWEQAFGFAPAGRIQIKYSFSTINLIPGDITDFARAYHTGDTKNSEIIPTQADLNKVVDEVGGFHKNNGTRIENTENIFNVDRDDQDLTNLIAHEDQHGLFKTVQLALSPNIKTATLTTKQKNTLDRIVELFSKFSIETKPAQNYIEINSAYNLTQAEQDQIERAIASKQPTFIVSSVERPNDIIYFDPKNIGLIASLHKGFTVYHGDNIGELTHLIASHAYDARLDAETDVANEVLAQITGRISTNISIDQVKAEVQESLTHTNYTYFIDNKDLPLSLIQEKNSNISNSFLSNESHPLTVYSQQQYYSAQEQESLVKQAVDAYEVLRAKGYNHASTTYLLQSGRLSEWRTIARRTPIRKATKTVPLDVDASQEITIFTNNFANTRVERVNTPNQLADLISLELTQSGKPVTIKYLAQNSQVKYLTYVSKPSIPFVALSTSYLTIATPVDDKAFFDHYPINYTQPITIIYTTAGKTTQFSEVFTSYVELQKRYLQIYGESDKLHLFTLHFTDHLGLSEVRYIQGKPTVNAILHDVSPLTTTTRYEIPENLDPSQPISIVINGRFFKDQTITLKDIDQIHEILEEAFEQNPDVKEIYLEYHKQNGSKASIFIDRPSTSKEEIPLNKRQLLARSPLISQDTLAIDLSRFTFAGQTLKEHLDAGHIVTITGSPAASVRNTSIKYQKIDNRYQITNPDQVINSETFISVENTFPRSGFLDEGDYTVDVTSKENNIILEASDLVDLILESEVPTTNQSSIVNSDVSSAIPDRNVQLKSKDTFFLLQNGLSTQDDAKALKLTVNTTNSDPGNWTLYLTNPTGTSEAITLNGKSFTIRPNDGMVINQGNSVTYGETTVTFEKIENQGIESYAILSQVIVDPMTTITDEEIKQSIGNIFNANTELQKENYLNPETSNDYLAIRNMMSHLKDCIAGNCSQQERTVLNLRAKRFKTYSIFELSNNQEAEYLSGLNNDQLLALASRTVLLNQYTNPFDTINGQAKLKQLTEIFNSKLKKIAPEYQVNSTDLRPELVGNGDEVSFAIHNPVGDYIAFNIEALYRFPDSEQLALASHEALHKVQGRFKNYQNHQNPDITYQEIFTEWYTRKYLESGSALYRDGVDYTLGAEKVASTLAYIRRSTNQATYREALELFEETAYTSDFEKLSNWLASKNLPTLSTLFTNMSDYHYNKRLSPLKQGIFISIKDWIIQKTNPALNRPLVKPSELSTVKSGNAFQRIYDWIFSIKISEQGQLGIPLPGLFQNTPSSASTQQQLQQLGMGGALSPEEESFLATRLLDKLSSNPLPALTADSLLKLGRDKLDPSINLDEIIARINSQRQTSTIYNPFAYERFLNQGKKVIARIDVARLGNADEASKQLFSSPLGADILLQAIGHQLAQVASRYNAVIVRTNGGDEYLMMGEIEDSSLQSEIQAAVAQVTGLYLEGNTISQGFAAVAFKDDEHKFALEEEVAHKRLLPTLPNPLTIEDRIARLKSFNPELEQKLRSIIAQNGEEEKWITTFEELFYDGVLGKVVVEMKSLCPECKINIYTHRDREVFWQKIQANQEKTYLVGIDLAGLLKELNAISYAEGDRFIASSFQPVIKLLIEKLTSDGEVNMLRASSLVQIELTETELNLLGGASGTITMIKENITDYTSSLGESYKVTPGIGIVEVNTSGDIKSGLDKAQSDLDPHMWQDLVNGYYAHYVLGNPTQRDWEQLDRYYDPGDKRGKWRLAKIGIDWETYNLLPLGLRKDVLIEGLSKTVKDFNLFEVSNTTPPVANRNVARPSTSLVITNWLSQRLTEIKEYINTTRILNQVRNYRRDEYLSDNRLQQEIAWNNSYNSVLRSLIASNKEDLSLATISRIIDGLNNLDPQLQEQYITIYLPHIISTKISHNDQVITELLNLPSATQVDIFNNYLESWIALNPSGYDISAILRELQQSPATTELISPYVKGWLDFPNDTRTLDKDISVASLIKTLNRYPNIIENVLPYTHSYLANRNLRSINDFDILLTELAKQPDLIEGSTTQVENWLNERGVSPYHLYDWKTADYASYGQVFQSNLSDLRAKIASDAFLKTFQKPPQYLSVEDARSEVWSRIIVRLVQPFGHIAPTEFREVYEYKQTHPDEWRAMSNKYPVLNTLFEDLEEAINNPDSTTGYIEIYTNDQVLQKVNGLLLPVIQDLFYGYLPEDISYDDEGTPRNALRKNEDTYLEMLAYSPATPENDAIFDRALSYHLAKTLSAKTQQERSSYLINLRTFVKSGISNDNLLLLHNSAIFSSNSNSFQGNILPLIERYLQNTRKLDLNSLEESNLTSNFFKYLAYVVFTNPRVVPNIDALLQSDPQVVNVLIDSISGTPTSLGKDLVTGSNFLTSLTLEQPDHINLARLIEHITRTGNPTTLESSAPFIMSHIKNDNIASELDDNVLRFWQTFSDHPLLRKKWLESFGFEFFLSLKPDQVAMYSALAQKIDDSPVSLIQKIKSQLIQELLEGADPLTTYEKINIVLSRNNLPEFMKIGLVFDYLYPQSVLETKITSITSPVIQREKSDSLRRLILQRDLFRSAIESGNRDLEIYLTLFRDNAQVVEKLMTGNTLTLPELKQVQTFITKMDALYRNTNLIRLRPNLNLNENRGSTGKELQSFIQNTIYTDLNIAPNSSLLTRLEEIFLSNTGYTNLGQIIAHMQEVRVITNERNLTFAASHPQLTLEAGDLTKGMIDQAQTSTFLAVLADGPRAKEFMGDLADSDRTPLDTDLSITTAEDAQGSFITALGKSVASNRDYGKLIFVSKNLPGRFYRSDLGETSSQGMFELFVTGVIDKERHVGIRGSYPSTYFDAIINNGFKAEELDALYQSMILNGFYIPVYSIEGNLIFTPQMYADRLKFFAGLHGQPLEVIPLDHQDKLSGLMKHYNLDPDIKTNVQDIARLENPLRTKVETVLASFGITLAENATSAQLTDALLVNIGSSGRGTNLPHDYDFDYTLILNRKDYQKSGEIATALRLAFPHASEGSGTTQEKFNQIRLSQLTLDGFDDTLELDIGITTREDSLLYSSNQAVYDRLNTLPLAERQSAISSILLAKKLLKEGHAYKPFEDKGFGGIGVENWILSNHGNIREAFETFWHSAHDQNGNQITLDEFRQKYPIYDPGTNLRDQRFDNYSRKLKEEGYQNMLKVIESYVHDDQQTIPSLLLLPLAGSTSILGTQASLRIATSFSPLLALIPELNHTLIYNVKTWVENLTLIPTWIRSTTNSISNRLSLRVFELTAAAIASFAYDTNLRQVNSPESQSFISTFGEPFYNLIRGHYLGFTTAILSMIVVDSLIFGLIARLFKAPLLEMLNQLPSPTLGTKIKDILKNHHLIISGLVTLGWGALYEIGQIPGNLTQQLDVPDLITYLLAIAGYISLPYIWRSRGEILTWTRRVVVESFMSSFGQNLKKLFDLKSSNTYKNLEITYPNLNMAQKKVLTLAKEAALVIWFNYFLIKEVYRDMTHYAVGDPDDIFGLAKDLPIKTEGFAGFVDQHIGSIWEMLAVTYVARIAIEIIAKIIEVFLQKKTNSKIRMGIAIFIGLGLVGAAELGFISGFNNVQDVLDLFGPIYGAVWAWIGFVTIEYAFSPKMIRIKNYLSSILLKMFERINPR